jgi:hypothetical protein
MLVRDHPFGFWQTDIRTSLSQQFFDFDLPCLIRCLLQVAVEYDGRAGRPSVRGPYVWCGVERAARSLAEQREYQIEVVSFEL